jgi:hypothetical protein
VVGRMNAPNYYVTLRETGYYSSLEWFRGFDIILELPGGNSNTRSIEVADMNGDGLPDLVIGNVFPVDWNPIEGGGIIFKDQEAAPNQVFLHDGTGFTSDWRQPYQTINDLPCSGLMETDDIIVADFNDDGYMDIVSHNSAAQKDQILMNIGDGISYMPPMNDKRNLWLPNPTPLL